MPDTKALQQQAHDLDQLLQRVQRGETPALPALRAVLAQRPEVASVLGDMTANVQVVMIHKLTETNQGMALCIETTMQEMKKTLAGPQPSALDTLLIERLLLDWLYLHLLELSELSQHGKQRTLTQAESMAKRIDRAHRRYHRSLMALAQVRRLMTPMVLVQMGLQAPRARVFRCKPL